MRLRSSLILVSLGIALAACQQKQVVVQQDREAANPFKYTKKSSVCKITPIVKEADGSWKTTMNVRSDDGQCEFTVEQPDSKGNFLSFGVTTSPEHGKTFLYNYDKRTYVRYTPNLAFAGTDKFTVSLLNQDGIKKTPLSVEVMIDNTGVQVAKPESAPVKSRSVSSHRKTVRHRTTKRRHVVKKAQ